jgi:hypothetical protein
MTGDLAGKKEATSREITAPPEGGQKNPGG